jgi:hypothetical protein
LFLIVTSSTWPRNAFLVQVTGDGANGLFPYGRPSFTHFFVEPEPDTNNQNLEKQGKDAP